MNETLRVNGRATLVSDAPFFDDLVARGRRPRLAVLVDVEELYMHCAKAFLRSSLWKPETWPSPRQPAHPRADRQGPPGTQGRSGGGDRRRARSGRPHQPVVRAGGVP
ncbi:hypothetical protein ACFSTC_31865 [Nonomuraea ferruginea]